MSMLWFHLVVVPGVFLLGRLTGSMTIAGFRIKAKRFRESSNM